MGKEAHIPDEHERPHFNKETETYEAGMLDEDLETELPGEEKLPFIESKSAKGIITGQLKPKDEKKLMRRQAYRSAKPSGATHPRINKKQVKYTKEGTMKPTKMRINTRRYGKSEKESSNLLQRIFDADLFKQPNNTAKAPGT